MTAGQPQDRDEIRELAIGSPFTHRQWAHARDILGDHWNVARPTVIEMTLKTGQTPDGAAQLIVNALLPDTPLTAPVSAGEPKENT